MRVSPSASEAERVPERSDVVVSEEPAISAMEPALGVVRTGASSTAVIVRLMAWVVVPPRSSVTVTVNWSLPLKLAFGV